MDGNEIVVEFPGGGIALNLTATAGALGEIKIGEKCLLHTELVIREDSWQLYGFASQEERKWFRLLNSVSGIGPKTAMATISVLGVAGVMSAIANDTDSALTAVPGLGKKGAARIVLELRDKVKTVGTNALQDDVVSALVNLGWTEKIARKTVNEIESGNFTTNELLREALNRLAKP